MGTSGCMFDKFPNVTPEALTINLCCCLISVTDVLTTPGWKLMVRYCSEKLTKLILISVESNIKYFSDSDLQPFTILATQFYKYDLLSPSFMQAQFKNRLFGLWPRVTSNILYLPEFFQTKQSANEHVKSEISLAALLSAGLGSRLKEKQPAQQAIVIRQTLRSPQSNLRGLHLWVCFSQKKKSLWTERACLLHFSPDWQHIPGEPRSSTCTLIQSDTPDLSRATQLAYRTLPSWKGHTMLCRGSAIAASPHLAPTHYHLESGQGECLGQPLNLRGSQLQNKGMTSEFGSDIRLVVPVAPWSGVFCYKWMIASLLQLHF